MCVPCLGRRLEHNLNVPPWMSDLLETWLVGYQIYWKLVKLEAGKLDIQVASVEKFPLLLIKEKGS